MPSSPSGPYKKAPWTKPQPASSTEDDDESCLRPEDFVRGKWAAEMDDWGAHCVPNGWMVCCLPCVSIAQISVRIGVESYGAAMMKQVAYNAVILAIVAVELVFVFRYVSSVADNGNNEPWTPLIVIFGCCFLVIALSLVWVKSVVKLRTRVRERFQIEGSISDDKSAIMWCTPCAIAQMATQVKSYKPGSCDFNAPDALPAYIP